MAKFRDLAVLLGASALIAGVLPSAHAAAAPVHAAAPPRASAPCAVPAAQDRKPESAAQNAPAPRAIKAAETSGTYSALLTPQRMLPNEEYAVEVKLTNTTQKPWPKADFALSYHWKLPDGTDYTRPSNRADSALPADVAPGQSVTVKARVKSPIHTDLGNQREAFVLDWDLRNTRTNKWLSETDQVPPLSQPVVAEYPTSNQLGLEKFYQYTATDAGAGFTASVNQFSGNAVVGYNAFSNPGRGLSTFVRLNYNSLDNSNSYVGPGWSLTTSSMTRLGSPLQFHVPLLGDPEWPAKVTFVDGDGTSHLFELDKHGSKDPAKWEYDSPAGVHLHLQRANGKDKNRTWVMTQPDRTQTWYDADGYQTALVDKNSNELRFTYQRTTHGNRNTGLLTEVTDPAGRRVLTLDYYQRGDDFFSFVDNIKVSGRNLLNTSIEHQLRSITDVSGRRITFTYSDRGQLQELVDGADTAAKKVFGFFYADPRDADSRLVRVNDPLGHGTQLKYYEDHSDHRRWRVQSVVDRRGHALGFDYADADGDDGSAISATITDANRRVTTVVLDSYGRPTKQTNAKGQVTDLAWDADNNVRVLRENNGSVSSWVYDQKTGYPLEVKDPEANARGTAPTKLSYRTGLNGYTADLTGKTTPEGRHWTFDYDSRGNLEKVTDPKKHATTYTYDEFGQLRTSTDANNHTTKYEDYDPVGYPRRTTDALNCVTTVAYDNVGNVLSTTDARQRTSTFTYDIFKRPLDEKRPKDAAAGQYIITPGPTYDANDNVVTATTATGAVSTAAYDENDQLVSLLSPKDEADGPPKRTTYSYDAVGNRITETRPRAFTEGGGDKAFTTTYSYDEINQLVAITDAAGHKTSYTYDSVGNIETVTDALRNAAGDHKPTKRFGYDRQHRATSVTDAAGYSTSREYDRDGKVISTTDQEGNKTLLKLDERAAVVEARVPHKRNGDEIVYHTTQFVYDGVGNRTKTISPRGVATPDDPDDFVTEIVYDELNRMKELVLPHDRDDERLKEPDRTFYSYDEAGRMTEVSAPPSAGQSVRNVTTSQYFDNGWVRSSTDPWNITTRFDYDNNGQQILRELTGVGGSSARKMEWEFYPDGKLKRRKDDGVPVGADVLVVDNSDPATEVKGDWGTGGAAGGSDHEGFDYRRHDAGSGADTFTWRIDVPRNGNYEVFVRYAETAQATDATYTVEHDGGTETKTVDQTTQRGKWVSLGKYGYTEDAIKKITLSDKANGTVVADAVKLVRDNSAEIDNEQKVFDYRYDANDNLVRLTDSSQDAVVDAYVVEYNGLDQIASLKESLRGNVKKATTYTYDANGNLKTRDHNSQKSTYDYDVRDMISKTTVQATAPGSQPQVTSFTYSPHGRKLTQVKSNGNKIEREYYLDKLLRHEVEKKADGTVVTEHTLEYDENNHRTKDISKKMNADNTSAYLEDVNTYTYDPRDRVRKVVKADTGGKERATETYVHDANNNVVEQTVDGKNTKFSYDRNRLQSFTVDGITATHSYDPFGRLEKVTARDKLVEKYRYDGFDRPVEHQQLKPNGTDRTTTKTIYDPLDRTTAKDEDGKKTDFSYLGLSGEVLTEEVGGKLTKDYQYTPDGQRLSQTKHSDDGGKETSFYGYDTHRDVETLTNEKGDTRATYGYTAYGQNDKDRFTGIDKPDAQDPTKDLYNPYRFNAKRFDKTSGDYDMGFRDYDPGRNRFLTRDSYNGALADLNLTVSPWTGNRYAFAGGNPISGVEIDGHDFEVEEGVHPADPHNAALAASIANVEFTFSTILNVKGNVTADLGEGGKKANTIPGGNRKGNGKDGVADLIFWGEDVVYVWEVKPGNEGGRKAGPAQLQRYVDKLQAKLRKEGDHRIVLKGPALPRLGHVPSPIGPLDVWTEATAPGMIFYGKSTTPERTPPPEPVPVPVPVPVPQPQPQPQPDGHAWWEYLLAGGAVIGGGALVVGTLAEDVATGGIGIADDPLTLGAGFGGIRWGLGVLFAW